MIRKVQKSRDKIKPKAFIKPLSEEAPTSNQLKNHVAATQSYEETLQF